MGNLKLTVYENGAVVDLLKRRGRGKLVSVAQFAIAQTRKEDIQQAVAEIDKQVAAAADASGV